MILRVYKKLFNHREYSIKMIRLLILDQEGTLYKNKKLLYKIRDNTKKFFCKKLAINEEDYFKWYSENKQSFPNIFEALKKFSISIEDYHNQVFDIIDPSNYLREEKALYNLLKKLNISIYVVTSSSRDYSKKVLNSLGIGDLIKKAISLSAEKQNKIDIYKEIIEFERVDPREVCVVGDNWDTDLKEAKEEGFKTILVGERDEYPFLIKSINRLSSAINQINYPKITFIDWKEVDKTISKLEEEIRRFNYHPDLIVGIARDGIIPAKLLNDRFSKIDLRILSCRRYYSGFSNDVPNIQIDHFGDIHNKKILLVDDAEDNGITLRSVKEKLTSLGAAEIKSAVLYSKARVSNAEFIGIKGKNFVIFPWNKFQELTEFLNLELIHSSSEEKLRVLTKMGFSKKDVLYCMERLTKGF